MLKLPHRNPRFSRSLTALLMATAITGCGTPNRYPPHGVFPTALQNAPAKDVFRRTSTDPDYGYSRDRPIRFGNPTGLSIEATQRFYLRHLRDPSMRPFTFDRVTSGKAVIKGHIVDAFELTDEDGIRCTIYIDNSDGTIHPIDAKAPKGMYLVR